MSEPPPLIYHLRVNAIPPASHFRTACGTYRSGDGYWGYIAVPPEWSQLVNCPECLECVHA